MNEAARPELPGADVHPVRRTMRYWLMRVVAWVLTRALFRIELLGRSRLPKGPAVYCFNHMNWIDPFVLMAVLPFRPRLYFFGPREEEMGVGGRNRLMAWTGAAIPYKPGKNDLLDATRRTGRVFKAGGVLAIAGEGRIHARESDLLPLNEGAAFFALRAGVPIVPVALHGTSWLAFGRRLRVTVGEPITASGRPTRETVEAATSATWTALHELVMDAPDPPGSRTLRALADRALQRWPEGSREASLAATPGGGTARAEG